MTTTTQDEAIETVIPDLTGIPVDRIAETGGTALDHAIRQYRERLKAAGVPLSSFQARI